MASITFTPFLYQTRTLLRIRNAPRAFAVARGAHYSRRGKKSGSSIPFEWDADTPNPQADDFSQSTITPTEAEIFKGIFDEISQGKVPHASDAKKSAKPGSQGQGQARPTSEARSMLEQTRRTDFAEKFLQRYPQSLRKAAQAALGLYELDDGTFKSNQALQLDEVDQAERLAEMARRERVREEESKRVTAILEKCTTEDQLWKSMEQNVFSLPEKLGILQPTTKERQTGKSKRTRKSDASKAEDDKHSIDIQGPLFAQYLNTGLQLFDKAFPRPSLKVFRILPMVKALGLPAYVLGMSTPFYTNLARIHWERFGDANSALDVLQEMNSMGLYADEEAQDLVERISDNVHACTWGAQGPFAMAMMESPPFDNALTQRISEMKKSVVRSLRERSREGI